MKQEITVIIILELTKTFNLGFPNNAVSIRMFSLN